MTAISIFLIVLGLGLLFYATIQKRNKSGGLLPIFVTAGVILMLAGAILLYMIGSGRLVLPLN